MTQRRCTRSFGVAARRSTSRSTTRRGAPASSASRAWTSTTSRSARSLDVSQDRLPERARGQLDRDCGTAILAIEDRVHLDELERADNPDSARCSHARCASRYVSPPFTGVPTPGAISGSSASRSSETWTKPAPDDSVDRLPHRPLDPDPVDLGHRDRANTLLPDQRALRGVERAHAHEHDALGVDGRELEAGSARRRPPRHRAPQRAASRVRSRSGCWQAC